MFGMFVASFLGTRSEISTTYISKFLERRESKTIFFPSVDQRGQPALLIGFESCTKLLPSASLIQISPEPARKDQKAMCWPSGEYWASCCDCVDGKSSIAGDSGWRRSIRQTLVRSPSALYASLSPLAETAGQPAFSAKSRRRDEPSAKLTSYSSNPESDA